MNHSSRPPPKGLLARGLKLVGRLTSAETRTGRVFNKAERGLTKVTARLSESPTWLRFSGGVMRRGFDLRIRRQSLQERALQALRLPASSEVEAMREQLRRLNHQVEALGSQLELVVDLLERQERAEPPGKSLEEAPPLEPVPRRKRGT
ncbi:hypothetical protein [Hyalangium rubrum]|uniref:Uncharacterized protein n=1 Tax=Hyalangium rubrum TaxID=3103134 RepID=A0ABU5H6S1_9BACT|nr:hypothetical protein [Hyalangium sp. s54d21]MDY7229174.1 hypothetical protein [Hyalangium sp. s54d21]